MTDRLRIGLLIESSRGYGRELLRGIAAYGRTHGSWVFYHEERDLGAPLPKNLAQWRPHGIIARLTSVKQARQVRQLNVPTVDLYQEEPAAQVPGITIRPETLSRLAADHFLQRGFTHFAYCGFPGVPFSDYRAKAFVEYLAQHDYQADVFACSHLPRTAGLAAIEAHVMRQSALLARWLRGLPKPVGLMACNDMRAMQVLAVCSENGVAVPDDVAVLGVDNDDVQCELANPPLSSIDPNVARIGYEAAALLHRLIRGEHPSPPRLLVEPAGVITRRSTDVLAIPDRDAAEAVRLLREHACDGMEVETILSRLSVSRSTLERWFRKWLGRSPSAEIVRVRLHRVKELLAGTDLPLEEIARVAGFHYVESMCRIMKRTAGQTPGEFRQQSRRLRAP